MRKFKCLCKIWGSNFQFSARFGDYIVLLTPVVLYFLTQVDVNGPYTAPIYNFLKAFAADQSDLGWNFVKFLVVNGYPVKRYNSRVSPKKIEKDILPYLSSGDL